MSVPRISLRPAPGARVRKPDGTFLAADLDTEVDWIPFWSRLAAAGDVILARPPRPARRGNPTHPKEKRA